MGSGYSSYRGSSYGGGSGGGNNYGNGGGSSGDGRNWEWIELSDGSFLVGRRGDNIHLNHYHVAPDGVILSKKVNGNHDYSRGATRNRISEITGVDIPGGHRW